MVTQDSAKSVSLWDIIACQKIKTFSSTDFDWICSKINTQEWVANWCLVDIKNGDLTIHLEEGRCYDAEVYFQDLIISKECRNEDQRGIFH